MKDVKLFPVRYLGQGAEAPVTTMSHSEVPRGRLHSSLSSVSSHGLQEYTHEICR